MGLETVELVMMVEEAFGIAIPDQAAEKLQTVGDMTDWVSDHLRTEGRPIERSEVRARVVAIVRTFVGETTPLHDNTAFVSDLGME